MRTSRRFIHGLFALAIITAVSVGMASPSYAAYNVCSQSIRVYNIGSAEGFTRMPADSTNTGNVECSMYRGVKDLGGNCAAGPCNPVRTLQTALVICEGYDIAIDGSFGPATESALKNWQSRKKLTVDGRYGPQTRTYMDWYKFDGRAGQYFCYSKGRV